MPLKDLNEAAAVPNRHLPIVGVRLHRLADAEHLRRDGLTADSAPGSSRLGQLGLKLAIFVEDLSLSCLDVLKIGRQPLRRLRPRAWALQESAPAPYSWPLGWPWPWPEASPVRCSDASGLGLNAGPHPHPSWPCPSPLPWLWAFRLLPPSHFAVQKQLRQAIR